MESALVLSNCDGAVVAGIVARLALGTAFMLAGLLKWVNKPDFDDLKQAVPLGSSRAFAIGLTLLPFIEVVLGLWLLIGRSTDASLIVTICLLIGFSVLLFWLIRSGYTHGCACFGSSDNYPIGPVHFVRNGTLLFAAIFAKVQNGQGCADLAVLDLPVEVLLMVLIVLVVSSFTYRGFLEIQTLYGRAHAANASRKLASLQEK